MVSLSLEPHSPPNSYLCISGVSLCQSFNINNITPHVHVQQGVKQSVSSMCLCVYLSVISTKIARSRD